MKSIQDRHSLLGTTWDCDCGEKHDIPVRRVLIQSDAKKHVPQVVRDYLNNGTALIICDQITQKIADETILPELSREAISFRKLVIPENKPTADERTAEEVLSKVRDETILISCGSGTVTDLTKYAAFKKGGPFIAFPTAPSMNGYASSIVAITENGLKKTAPAKPPVAVIADLDIISNAPMEMIQAGLGDVISKPVCNADWKLSSIVKGEPFCPIPFELIADLESMYYSNSKEIAQRKIETVQALMEALVFSGVSMIIAGSSAPASGAEHLISHTLDMQAGLHKREHDFHGAQVGIASIITAKLYEEIFSIDIDSIDWTGIWEHHKAGKALKIRDYWHHLAPQVMIEYEKKWMPWSQKKEELSFIVNNWDKIKKELKVFLRPSVEIEKVLNNAGAKTHFSELGISKEELKEIIIMALTMRSRYTILDLADDLNLLEKFTDTMVSS